MLNPTRNLYILMVFATLVLSAFAGYVIGTVGFQLEYGLAAIMILLVLVLMRNDKQLWLLLGLGVLTVIIGERGLPFIGGRLTPMAAIMVLIFGFLLLNVITNPAVRQRILPATVPPLLIIFSVGLVAIIGLHIIAGNAGLSQALPFALPHLIGVIVFANLISLVDSEKQFDILALLFMVVSLGIGSLGIIEQINPSWLSWAHSDSVIRISFLDGGFQRAGFLFWGNPTVGAVILWGVVLAVGSLVFRKDVPPREFLFYVVVIAIGLYAIYISGNRNSWIAAAVVIPFVAFARSNNKLLGVGLVLLALYGITQLPDSVWNRLEILDIDPDTGFTLTNADQGRANLYSNAIEIALINPLTGDGQFAARPTHNVYLELLRKTGFPTTLVFIAFHIAVAWGIFQAYIKAKDDDTKHRIFLWGVLFALTVFQSMTILVYNKFVYAVPFWLITAIAWYYPHFAAYQQRTATSTAQQQPLATQATPPSDHRAQQGPQSRPDLLPRPS